MRSRVFALALLSLAVACAPAAEETAAPAATEPAGPDLEQARAQLTAADEAWFAAFSQSETPAETFADLFVEGGHLLPPEAPLATGRDEIVAVIGALVSAPGFTVEWTPTLAEVGSAGDLGYTLGTYSMELEVEGQLVRIEGKYVTVWRKQDDGTWKVTADMFNANGPPTPVQ